MSHGKVGRPTKKTPEIVEILLKCFRVGLHIETACGFAKIDKGTYYDWIKADPNFATQIEFARSQAIIELTQEVRKLDSQGPWKILKNVAPHLYKDKMQTEHIGKDGGPIEIKHSVKRRFKDALKDERTRETILKLADKLYGDPDGET